MNKIIRRILLFLPLYLIAGGFWLSFAIGGGGFYLASNFYQFQNLLIWPIMPIMVFAVAGFVGGSWYYFLSIVITLGLVIWLSMFIDKKLFEKSKSKKK